MDRVVRIATAADREAIWPLARELATSYVPTAEAFAASFDQVLDASEAVVLVAEMEGAVVGYVFVCVHPTFFANGPVGWVEELMVAEGYRGRGVGRLLMAAAEHWARPRGAAYVGLATRRAAEFYRAIGYAESADFFKKEL